MVVAAVSVLMLESTLALLRLGVVCLMRCLVAHLLNLFFVVQAVRDFKSDLGLWLDTGLVVLACGGIQRFQITLSGRGVLERV